MVGQVSGTAALSVDHFPRLPQHCLGRRGFREKMQALFEHAFFVVLLINRLVSQCNRDDEFELVQI